MIRRMSEQDISRAVRLYKEYMFDSFFASLGESFVDAVFRGMLQCNYAINLVYEHENKIKGFIVVSIDTSVLFWKVLRKQALRISLSCLFNLAKRPRIVLRLCETLLYLRKAGCKGLKAEFLFIAIEQEWRRKGIARILVEEAMREFKKAGVKKAKVTVLDNNVAVKNLLANMGFEPLKAFRFYGKNNRLFTCSIP